MKAGLVASRLHDAVVRGRLKIDPFLRQSIVLVTSIAQRAVIFGKTEA